MLHCPYCHGWEVRDEPLAILGSGAMAIERARLISGWSRDLVICSNGPSGFDDEQRAQLQHHEIAVYEEPIARLQGRNGVLDQIVFASGAALPRRAIFVLPRQHLRSELAERLGCTFTSRGPDPQHSVRLIEVDERGQTGIPGVYAAGDATTPMQQAIMAAADGARAAAMINHELATEDWAA